MRFIVTDRAIVCLGNHHTPITAIGRRSISLRAEISEAQEARQSARQRRLRTTNQTPRPRPRRLAEATLQRIARGIERFIIAPAVQG